MKKVILILLCLALTLNFASAVAETAEKTAIGTISMNGAFELRGVLPEGYQLTVITEEPGHYLASLSADDSKPAMAISIAYDELMSEVDRLPKWIGSMIWTKTRLPKSRLPSKPRTA